MTSQVDFRRIGKNHEHLFLSADKKGGYTAVNAGFGPARTGKRNRTDISMQIWFVLAAINGFLAVAFGAFGAHGLAARPPADLAAFKTGADYHMYHALALFAVGWFAANAPSLPNMLAGIGFLAGILLFSGSLYFLGITGSRSLVIITPIGGVAFLAGWACLAWTAWKSQTGA